MLDRFPKPAVIGAVVIILLLAAIVIFKTVSGGGENAGRPSRQDAMRAQQGQQGHTQTSGH